MKIGLIAPPWVAVPPRGYGGTEVVVANLAKGLTELGHDVRLFTIGESTCPQACGYVFDEAVTPIGEPVSQAIQAAAAYEELSGVDGVDIIHDHTWIGPLLAQEARSTIPVVTTMHQLFVPMWRRYYTLVGRTASIIARCRARRTGTESSPPSHPWVATSSGGIPTRSPRSSHRG